MIKFVKALVPLTAALIAMVAVSASPAQADTVNSCIDLFKRRIEYSTDLAIAKERFIPIENLFSEGVGMIPIPKAMLDELSKLQFEDGMPALGNPGTLPIAVDHLVEYLSREVQAQTKRELRIRRVSLVATPGLDGWHTDAHSYSDINNAQDKVAADLVRRRQNPLKRNVIRITAAFPILTEGATMLKPWSDDQGPGYKTPIGAASVFISGATFHSADARGRLRHLLVIEMIPGM